MAASFTCDGCMASVEVPIVIGHVLKRDYCELCAARAAEFITAEEDLRKETQARFVEARGKLIGAYGVAGFQLPDVP
jgi:hypothetical protein